MSHVEYILKTHQKEAAYVEDDEKWYVIYTRTGDELKVKRLIELLFCKLKRKSIRVLIPKRAIIERKGKNRVEKIKFLFPGYVFIKTCMSHELYNDIKRLPRFLKFLKDGIEPAEVREEEINIILALIGDSDIVGFSTGIKVGGKVKIIDGPLKGFEGLIEKIDKRKGRVKVRLNVSGNVNLVDLGIRIVENLDKNEDKLSEVS
ncbi:MULTISPECIES: antiterminator LoaP [unclassified Thermoanaerobacterium]|uniref:antiterminator LoaP n=1 Tax=unclassified Thermoanaerobacterium TaxID=2622527 RepID=UPI001F0AE133|nr:MULTISPECIES: antiterminator LoaP [unclassified Thermoanaerobacterium]